MKLIFLALSIFLATNLYPVTPVIAQTSITVSPSAAPPVDYVLPYPGILPDHPLYFLKTLRDKILIFLTRDKAMKSQRHLLLADKNLVMGQLLWEKEKFDLSVRTLKVAEEYFLQAVLNLDNIDKNNKFSEAIDKLEIASKKHEEIIWKLQQITSEGKHSQTLNEVLGITHQAIQKITTLKSLQ